MCNTLPVMGASTSSMHFSWRRMLAPSLMIRRAASSSRRPSFTRWLFKSSTLGLPSSYSSFMVSRVVGGYGTAAGKRKKDSLFSLASHRETLLANISYIREIMLYIQDDIIHIFIHFDCTKWITALCQSNSDPILIWNYPIERHNKCLNLKQHVYSHNRAVDNSVMKSQSLSQHLLTEESPS